MNITDEILNPREQSTVTSEVLGAGKGLSLSEQILFEGTPTATQEILNPEEPSTVYLPLDVSEVATEQSKHLYGDEAPEIYTEEDLEDANEYEGSRLLDENDTKSINKTLTQVVNEGVQKAVVNRAAAQSAWDRFLAEKFKFDGGLRASDLRQHQAEALANNDFDGVDSDFMQLYQSKVDVIDKVRREIVDRIYKRGYFKDFGAKWWDALKNVIPGYAQMKAADMMGRGVFETTPAQNMRDFHRLWHDALTSDEISTVQFEAMLRTALDHFDIAGTTNEELLDYIDRAFDMSTGVVSLELAGDLAVVGGTVGKTIKTGVVKGGKAASVAAVRSVAPYLNARGVKAVVRAGSSPIKTAKNIGGDLIDVIKRKRFVGDVEGATKTALSKLRPEMDVSDVKKLLGDPDIVNLQDPKTKKVTTVIETILGDAARPDGSAISNISTEGPILTTRRYNDLLFRTSAELGQIMKFLSVESLQETLKNMDGAFEKSIEGLLYRVRDDLISKKKVGDIIKAIPAKEIPTDMEGSLVVRMRLPNEYKTEKAARLVASKLNPTYAQQKEVIPLTSGKFAVEVDFNTHKGFGQLLMEVPKKGGRDTWSTHVISGGMTITGTPTGVRQLDYIRSMQSDFFERMGKDSQKIVKGLSKEERRDLELLESAMTDVSKPGQYSPELLLAKGFTPATVDASMRLRQMRDINFLVINNAERMARVREGMRVITVNGRELGQGLLISPSDPEQAIRIVKGSKKNLIIGNIDAIPVREEDLAELADVSATSLLTPETANKATKNLASKLQNAKSAKSQATLRAIEEGAFHDTYEKIRKGEYIVLQTTVDTSGETSARDLYYILPKNSVVDSDLPAFVMNYVPGWSKFYDRSANYVKQARVSNGQAVGVTTVMGSTNFVQLEKNTPKIETLRKYVAANRPDMNFDTSTVTPKYLDKIKRYKEGFEDLLQQQELSFAPFKNEDEFIQWCAQNRIDITNVDNPLQIVRNNEVPTLVKEGSIQSNIKAMDKDSVARYMNNGPVDAIQSEWQQRQHHRYGGSVLNYDFTEQASVDIDKTLQYFVNDMINEGIMPRYEETYANIFGDQFRKTIEGLDSKAKYLSNSDLLRNNGVNIEALYRRAPTSDLKEKLSQAMTAQKNFSMIRGVPNSTDKYISDAGYGILRRIGATADALHIPEKLRQGVRAPFEWIVNQKPMKLAQAIAAHRFLGCLNLVQMTKNFLGPASLIIAADPKNGSAAFKDVFTLTHRFMKQDKNLAAALDKLDAALGIEKKTSTTLMRNLLLMDTHNSGVKGGLLSEAVKSNNTASKVSLYFFNRADFANRLMASDTALRALGYDRKLLTNPLEVAKVGAYADALYVNMSKRGLSRLQATDWSKTFTQFMGYMFKYAETMLTDKELTGVQRGSMITSTLLLAGIGGMVGTDVYHSISSGLGADMSDEDSTAKRVVKEVFAKGVPDTMFKELGVDVSVQNLFGPNVFEKLDDFANSSILTMISSAPAVKTISDYSSAALDFFHFLGKKYGEGGEYFRWSDLLNQLLVHRKTISSAERLNLAYEMWNTGRKFSSSGQLTSEDNSKLQALLSLFGLDSQKTIEVYLSQKRRQTRKEQYEESLKDIMKYERLASQGNVWAGAAARQKLMDSDFTWAEQLDLRRAMNRNAIMQSRVPLDLREWRESAKSKIKTGESTYKIGE